MQLKKCSIILVILFFVGLWGQAQIIQLYKQLDSIKSIKDTSISLRYFKNPDAEICSYLDSFSTYLASKPDINIDSNFYYEISFENGYYINKFFYDKPKIAIHYRNDYAYYNYFAGVGKGDESVFAFFFYKEKLVLCTIASGYNTSKNKRIFVTESDFNIVKNLIYEQMSVSVKKEIDTKTDNYRIITRPLKEYRLKE